MPNSVAPVGKSAAISMPEHFADSIDHITAELQRLDLMIQLQVRRARQLHKGDEQFQGLFISEQDVDDLLRLPLGSPRFLAAGDPADTAATEMVVDRMGHEINTRVAESMRRGVFLRLAELAVLFDLSSFDCGCLLACLAPEVDPRYERLYAYIADDATKKHVSIELLLNLFCSTLQAKLQARPRFAQSAPLQKWRLLQWIEDSANSRAALPSRPLRMDERIASYLLGSDEIDSRLLSYVRYVSPEANADRPFLPDNFHGQLSQLYQSIGTGGVLYFQGPLGIGKEATAAALSSGAGYGLLTFDVEVWASLDSTGTDEIIRRVVREAKLLHATLYCKNFGLLQSDEKRGVREKLFKELSGSQRVCFLEGEESWEPSQFTDVPVTFVRVEFPRITFAERLQEWDRALSSTANASLNPESVAGKFRLNASQIRSAATTARSLALWQGAEASAITNDHLHEACRLHSNRKLATLARKIRPHYRWDDIILPADKAFHLREICNSMKHRVRVYEQWGFDRKLSLGKGLNVLFAGPPGTGKTMGADIIAGELGLDLYKIDLSSLVSKYIGETEKNLARIFSEAETSNAILFFDEADAMFGKRSEVRDSHDRYANIEVGYLLQRMEEYDGVVILATNFRKNMDEAFVRRIHFTVEFPFPGEAERRRIWERIWPESTPVDHALDLDFMAKSFELAGGSIKNIALAAAFLAAENGGRVNLPHLLHATRREYQKMGKVAGHAEFERVVACTS